MTGFGAALGLAGLALAVRGALLLAGRGRPRRGPRPRFVIAGVYRRTRNPIFAGLVMIATGVAVVSPSPTTVAGAVAVAGLLHLVVIAVEEPRLRARFGEMYEAYCRAVPRWLPLRASRSRGER